MRATVVITRLGTGSPGGAQITYATAIKNATTTSRRPPLNSQRQGISARITPFSAQPAFDCAPLPSLPASARCLARYVPSLERIQQGSHFLRFVSQVERAAIWADGAAMDQA